MKLSISASPRKRRIDPDVLKTTASRILRKGVTSFLRQSSVDELASVIEGLSYEYYRSSPLVPDGVYDELYDALAELDPENPALTAVDAPVRAKKSTKSTRARVKVSLKYPMFSLSKAKPGTGSVDRFASKWNGSYVVSDKLDSIALQVVYSKGVPSAAYTRGKDQTGQDVSHLLPYLKIPARVPTKNKDFVVRGEVILTRSVFSRLFDQMSDVAESDTTFANARNAVGGAVNSLSIDNDHPALPHVRFVAFEIINPRVYTTLEAFDELKSLGFKVPFYKELRSISDDSLSSILSQRKSKSLYEVDGLVVEKNAINKRPSGEEHHPTYAIAFKQTTDADIVETKVEEVEWNVSKHGTAVPRIRIKPVRLAGVTVTYASGHNAFFIQNGFRLKDKKDNPPIRPIAPGAVVRVTRSGDVIPHIVEVVKGCRRPAFPDVEYEWSGVNIKYKSKGTDWEVTRNHAFFKALGVKDIGAAAFQRLAESGFNSVQKIVSMKLKDFVTAGYAASGLGKKYYEAIKKSLVDVPLPVLMAASGVFGPGIGVRQCQKIVSTYPNILTQAQKLNQDQLTQMFLKLPGVKTVAPKMSAGIPKFIRWLASTKVPYILPSREKKIKGPLNGVTVLFTKFRDADLSDLIVKNGGTVATSFTKDVNVLLLPSMDETSAKVEKARRIADSGGDMKILTPKSFITKFKLR